MKALIRDGIYDLVLTDPESTLVDWKTLPADELRQVTELMGALGELREAEKRVADASRRYMKLNETDMAALRYLIVCHNRGTLATPGELSRHLGISTPSTTKMLDRLEKRGHITRQPHPTDRRALAIAITPATHIAARTTVGRQQARRFHAAARLTAEERQIVTRFLRDMAQELEVRQQEPDASLADEGG